MTKETLERGIMLQQQIEFLNGVASCFPSERSSKQFEIGFTEEALRNDPYFCSALKKLVVAAIEERESELTAL